MKKFLKSTAIAASVVCLALIGLVVLQSCDQESQQKMDQKTIEKKDFRKDLHDLIEKEENLLLSINDKITRSGDEPIDEEDDGPDDNSFLLYEEIANEIDAEITEFCQTHDVVSDLTLQERGGLLLSEDDYLEIILDELLFDNYLQNYKTPEFRNMLYNYKNGTSNYTIDDIVDNTSLKMIEKLTLATIVAIDENLPISERVLWGFGERTKDKSPWGRQYNRQLSSCDREFVIETAVSAYACMSGIGGLIAYGGTCALYIDCKYTAAGEYDDCKHNK